MGVIQEGINFKNAKKISKEMFCSYHLTAATLNQMNVVKVYWPDAHIDPNLIVKLVETQ